MDTKVCLTHLLRHRYVKTAALVFSWICLGFYSTSLGSSVPTLKEQVNVTTEEIARVLSGRSFGLFMGSVAGGFLHDHFNNHRWFIVSCALFLASIFFFLIVFCKVLWVLGVVLFISGCSHGLHTTGGNPLLVDVWKERSAGPLNVLHAGYGVGGALAPLIIKSFIEPRTEKAMPMTTENGGPSYTTSVNATLPEPRIVLVYSYAIMSFACFLSSMFFLSVWLSTRHQASVTLEKEGEAATPQKTKLMEFWVNFCSSRRNILLTLIILIAVFLFYGLVVGGDRSHNRFLFLYAKDSALAFNNEKAFLLNVLYWVFFTVSRLTAAVATICISVELILVVELIGSVASSAVMMIFPDSETAFWISSSAFSFFKSPTFPTGLGVLNYFLEVTGIVTLLINCGSAVGGIVMQWLTGFFFDRVGPKAVLYSDIIHTCLLLGVGVLLMVVGRVKGTRFLDGRDTNSGEQPEMQQEMVEKPSPAVADSNQDEAKERLSHA